MFRRFHPPLPCLTVSLRRFSCCSHRALLGTPQTCPRSLSRTFTLSSHLWKTLSPAATCSSPPVSQAEHSGWRLPKHIPTAPSHRPASSSTEGMCAPLITPDVSLIYLFCTLLTPLLTPPQPTEGRGGPFGSLPYLQLLETPGTL